MHFLRSLMVLLVAATVSFAQAPKSEQQIAMSAHIITVHWSALPTFKEVWLNGNLHNREDKDRPTKLTEILKPVQEHRAISLLQSPKATTRDGQPVTITTGKPKTIITGFDKAGEPVSEPVHEGVQLKLKATTSKDGKSFDLDIDAKYTVINSNVPLTPVVKMVAPVGNPPGSPPVPFTTFHLKPEVQIAKHSGLCEVRNGGSRIWDMGTLSFNVERSASPAVVARIPYVSRLFKSPKVTQEKYQVYVIVSADILPADPLVK